MNKSGQERIANVVAALEKLADPIDKKRTFDVNRARDLAKDVYDTLRNTTEFGELSKSSYYNDIKRIRKAREMAEQIVRYLREI